jgi:UPF0755 protein
MMRTFLKLAILLIVVLLLGGAIFASIMWGRMQEPFRSYTSVEQFVEIPQGATTREIGRRLVEAGVVRDEFTFRASLLWDPRSRTLKAGEYRFDQPMNVREVIDKLARGEVYARHITFPEGLTILEMSRIYQQQGFGPAEDFVRATGDTSAIADLDAQAPNLEGYLFPETYAIPRGTPPARLLAMMVERFRAAYSEALHKRGAAQGLTTRQVVTLASLVEKETAREDERPLVAAVYRNRMEVGMGMQADPTLIYALEKAGKYDGNIRKTDLDFDSPYNTYKYPGLPPGPIASPGRASLEAALNPANVRYLFFVSRNDGSHVFATTLAEHNKNVRRFQVLYFREKRQKEKAAALGDIHH